MRSPIEQRQAELHRVDRWLQWLAVAHPWYFRFLAAGIALLFALLCGAFSRLVDP